MSRFYRTSQTTPIDFGYNLPYQEMLQGLQMREQFQAAGEQAVSQAEAAGMALQYMKQDAEKAQGVMNWVQENADYFSNLDLTDPVNSAQLKAFTREVAKTMGPSGIGGAIQGNYNRYTAFQQELKDLEDREEFQKAAALRAAYEGYTGVGGTNKRYGERYNVFTGETPEKFFDIPGFFRDEMLKMEKDITEGKFTALVSPYFKTETEYNEYTPDQRKQIVAAALASDPRVQAYINDAQKFGYDPAIQALGKEGYLSLMGAQGASMLGETHKKGIDWSVDAVQFWKLKKAAIDEAYMPTLKNEPYTLRETDAAYTKTLKELDQVLSVDGFVAEFTMERDWDNLDDATKKRLIGYAGGKPFDQWTDVEKQMYWPEDGVMTVTKTTQDWQEMPDKFRKIVIDYYSAKGKTTGITNEDARTALKDYRAALEQTRMQPNSTVSFDNAIINKNIAEYYAGTKGTNGIAQVYQDVIIYEKQGNEYVPIAQSWNDEAVPSGLRGSYVGEDSEYKVTAYGISPDSPVSENAVGGVELIYSKGDKYFKVIFPEQDPVKRQSYTPVASYGTVTDPMNQSFVEYTPNGDPNNRTLYIKGSTFVPSNGRLVMSGLEVSYYPDGRDSRPATTEEFKYITQDLSGQASYITNTVIPAEAKKKAKNADKTAYVKAVSSIDTDTEVD